MEPGIQTPENTLQMATGSCRDSTWLLVQVLRHLGLAARFASGYLIQLAGEDPGEQNTSKQDSVDLHAWAEVFLPGAGWIGLDPTSGLLAGEGHIPLACTANPGDAAPITGTTEPSGVDFTYSLTVQRRVDEPRPSTPFTEDEWAKLEKVAHQVDQDIHQQDIRLTMGGEPTFVSIHNPDTPEWNIEATGPTKRRYAAELITKVRQQMAAGALLHFGQGKWYPGEVLPRWALKCYWRADGVPVWEDVTLIAREDHDNGFGHSDALRYMQALTRRLQVSAGNILPAYEDALYYVWSERRLPVNVDVLDSKLASARERQELARVFEQGLSEPVGYVLPIRRRQHQGRKYWSSQLWFLRPERLFLLQGDSPLGYRLPLDSLPWVAPDQIDYEFEPDPFATREKLPNTRERRMDWFQREGSPDP